MRAELRQNSRMLSLLLLSCLVSQPAPSQEVQLAPEKRAQLEAVISKFMATDHVPGVSVAVVEDGKEVWSTGFGMADLENFVPATSRTLYRLGSISKPITAVAAMRLWEQGKLDLDAPVQKYCPKFPQKPEGTITTRELLGHLAGIRHYRPRTSDDMEWFNVTHFDDPIAGGLKFFESDPLVAAPGTKFSYSTHGYTVVGCAIEGASSQRYLDYVEDGVLKPMGMTSTAADDRYSIIPYRARFYHKDAQGKVVNADLMDSSYKIPGGGWLSSADDMARFEIAIMKDELLRRATRDLMFTSQKTTDGKATDYGLGWDLEMMGDVRVVRHTGAQQGTTTAIFMSPERNLGVVLLTNMDGLSAGPRAREMMSILLGMK